MSEQPQWTAGAESTCIQNWTDYFYAQAKHHFNKDGTHVSLLCCFSKENGLVSVDPVPPKTDEEQLDFAVRNAVKEHNLYGIIFIGEVWMYFVKEKDHTAFQLLDGEMKVSDLNDKDKKEALIVRMENRDGGGLIYLNEIIRSGNSGTKPTLKEGKASNESHKKWF